MHELTLEILKDSYAIHRLPAEATVPNTVLASPFFAVMRTTDELSLVVPESIPIASDRTEPDWICFKVDTVLEFNLVGILAKLASVLATAQVSIFALSSFDTDYLLVKREQKVAAVQALETAGYRITQSI
jgi:hypothetical protein